MVFMRIGLLGTDDEALQLAAALADESAFELVWAHSPDEPALQKVARWFSGLTLSANWEELLAGVADVVVVGRAEPGTAEDDEVRADQLRKLVQEGVPLVVLHPIHESMLVYFELDMIRRERGGPLIPWLPWRAHSAIQRLLHVDAEIASETAHSWQQCTIEREAAKLDRKHVLAALAQDADLVRCFCGDISKVAAMKAGMSDNGLSSVSDNLDTLAVQFSAVSGAIARWSVARADGEPKTRISLMRSGCRATLTAFDAGSVSLELKSNGQTESFEFPRESAGPLLAKWIEQSLAGGGVAATWPDATRAMELVNAVQRSLERGRIVELYQEEASEENTFKGMMAAGGCLLLLLGVAVTVLASAAGGFGLAVANYWPVCLLAILGGFLLLQTLRLVFPQP